MIIKAESEIIGIVLAGGESRRFGSPKAFVEHKGDYFINYSLRALQSITGNIIVVSHPSLTDNMKKRVEMKVIEDLKPFHGKGPLAGIYSAISCVNAKWYVVLPCDTPNITNQIIEKIVSFRATNVDAIIPIIAGKMQPLIAVYNHSVKEKIKRLLEEGTYNMRALAEDCHVKYVSEVDLETSGYEFHNVNYSSDLPD